MTAINASTERQMPIAASARETVDAGGEPVAQLRVSHPQSNIMGRGIKLWLDGNELQTLKAGNVLTVDVQPGAHTLRMSNTYKSKTVTFDAKPGEQVHYIANNKIGLIGGFLLTVLGSGPMSLVIERAEAVEPSSTSQNPSIPS